MKLCLRYVRLFIFAIALLFGLQVPGFVEQYGIRLEARLLESKNNLGAFQDDADKYFSGDINRLIAHYKNKPDQIIQDGGVSIEAILIRNQTLISAHQNFTKNNVAPYLHTFFQPVHDVRENTLNNYNFMVLLNSKSILFGLSLGVSFILLIDFLLMVLSHLFKSLIKRPKPRRNKQQKAPSLNPS